MRKLTLTIRTRENQLLDFTASTPGHITVTGLDATPARLCLFGGLNKGNPLLVQESITQLAFERICNAWYRSHLKNKGKV